MLNYFHHTKIHS